MIFIFTSIVTHQALFESSMSTPLLTLFDTVVLLCVKNREKTKKGKVKHRVLQAAVEEAQEVRLEENLNVSD